MTNEKKGFILYYDWGNYFQMLELEDRGKLITALFEYQNSGTKKQQLFGKAEMAFAFMRDQFDRDNKKYEQKRQKLIANGKKGGRPTKAKGFENNQKVFIENQAEPNESLTDTDTETNTDTDTETNTDTDTETVTNINIPQAPKGEKSALGDRFSRFWDAYPKKAGKAAAEKAFKKIKPSEELLKKMLDAIESQKKSDQWKKDRGQFIPHPATWLNRGQWEDEDSESSFDASLGKSFDADDFFDAALKRTFREFGIDENDCRKEKSM